jgi:hypothetical protein
MCVDMSHILIVFNELQLYSIVLLCCIMTSVDLCPVTYSKCMIGQFDSGCDTTHRMNVEPEMYNYTS